MKVIKTILVICLLTTFSSLFAQLPAFPTAEGFGKWATGGRGGKVVEVTNLQDNGTGSFRWALAQYPSEPVTVVFRVSGIINLESPIRCSRTAGTTIAGQTAPGDGICIRGAKCNFGGCKNMIIRHLRFRIGLGENGDGSSYFIEGGSIGIENASNWIIDHCTFGWSGEENMTIYDNTLTTIQWCLVHEGLYDAGHGKGARGYGCQWGGQSATYHHNLLAHNKSRSPRLNGARSNDRRVLIDYVNNVNYNWGNENACYGADMDHSGISHRINFVNNYYKPGPARPGNKSSYYAQSSFHGEQNTSQISQWYMSGNYMGGTANTNKNTNNYNGLDAGPYTSRGISKNQLISNTAFEVPNPVNTQTAQDAYESVLAGAGAFPRDAVDTRIISEVRNGTANCRGSIANVAPGIIDRPSDAGGYPEYKTYNSITDNDHDGMDDYWEAANGLDACNPDDRNFILKSGYTALEAYLCGLCGEEIAVEFSKPYDIVVAKDNSGDYTSIQAALDAAPESAARTLIFVKNGEYKEKLFLGTRYQSSDKVISLIGENVDSVVIVWDDYLGKEIDYPGKDDPITADGATCPTFTINAPDFYMENITVMNPSTNAQAVAICHKGDRHVVKNCKILGNQDTHRTKKGRRYFYYGCTIEGGVDFIYAGGTCYFYKCDIVSNRSGYISAPEDIPYRSTMSNGKPLYYGFFFNDCNLVAKKGLGAGSCYLGRPWGESSGSIFMNCRLGNHINAKAWMEWNGNEKNCSFAEYKNLNADGTALADVSKRASWSMQIAEDDRYYLMNLKNIYQKINAGSPFDPLPSVVAPQAPAQLTVNNRNLSWTAVDKAIGYVIYANDAVLDYAESNSYYDMKSTGKVSYKVKAIGENGCLSGINGSVDSISVDVLDSILNPDYRVRMETNIFPPEAGRISVSPEAVSYDKNAIVDLCAHRNYGYRFLRWIDEDSLTLSTDTCYQHRIEREIVITALFEKLPAYTLSVKNSFSSAVGGKHPDLLKITPSPVWMDGVYGYEAGTKVRLEALGHPLYVFEQWEDGKTTACRTISMDKNQTLTAQFAQKPFIAGWEFSDDVVEYYPSDYHSNTDNIGEMNLLDSKQNYLTWERYPQGYFSKEAIINAQPMDKKCFFQAEFSTMDYSDVLVWSAMKIDQNGYKNQTLEYSLDFGKSYTAFGRQEIPQTDTWTIVKAWLPAEACRQSHVQVRWIPDYHSELFGSISANDGTVLSDVYLLIQEPDALAKTTQDHLKVFLKDRFLFFHSSIPLTSVCLYNITGHCVKQENAKQLECMDVSDLDEGVYLFSAQKTDGSHCVGKIIK